MIFEIFNGLTKTPSTETGTRRKVPASLWSPVRGLLANNPRQRSSVSAFVSSTPEINNSDLVKLSEALPSLKIDEDFKFQQFLDLLQSVEDKFPRKYLHEKILPQLVECFELGKGGIQLLTLIIRLSKDFNPEKYKIIITPIIVKQFSSNNRAIRTELLQSLPDYIEYLDKRVVSDKIYPPLSTGFSDTEPMIREQTVRSVFVIAPKLNDRLLNGDLLRQLAKVQNDSQKEIRANTTILLGKIAPLFSQSTRLAVLVVAFGRALKDPFVESRLAALRALGSAEEYFGIQEICNKILGTLAPALVDSDKRVREEAFSTFNAYFDKVKDHASELDEKHNATVGDSLGGGSNDPSRVGSPAGGWTNWASTITSNLASKAGAAGAAGLTGAINSASGISNTGNTTTPSSIRSGSENSSAAPSRTVTPSIFEGSQTTTTTRSSVPASSSIKRTPLPSANKPVTDGWDSDANSDGGANAWGSFGDDDDNDGGDDDGWGTYDDTFDNKKSTNNTTKSSMSLSDSMKSTSLSQKHSSSSSSSSPLSHDNHHHSHVKKQTFASTFGTTALGTAAHDASARKTMNSIIKKHDIEQQQKINTNQTSSKPHKQAAEEEEDGWGAWDS